MVAMYHYFVLLAFRFRSKYLCFASSADADLFIIVQPFAVITGTSTVSSSVLFDGSSSGCPHNWRGLEYLYPARNFWSNAIGTAVTCFINIFEVHDSSTKTVYSASDV